MIDFMIDFMIGLFVGFYFSWLLFKDGNSNLNGKGSGKEKHHRPEYYGYEGGWDKVVVCSCGSVSLYEDNHPVRPCRDCGTMRRREEKSGRWIGSEWELHND